MCPSLRLGMTLLAFFGSSSRLTSFKEELKDVDDQHRQGGQRDWQQVRCCSFMTLGPGVDSVEQHKKEGMAASVCCQQLSASCSCQDRRHGLSLGALSSKDLQAVACCMHCCRQLRACVT